MTTIELPRSLINPFQQLAAEQGSSVEKVIEIALTEYLRDVRHKQLLQEMERFHEMHGELKGPYSGQFVGMYDGRILDHDPDGSILYNRLRQQYGDLPILIVEVGETTEQEFVRLSRYQTTNYPFG